MTKFQLVLLSILFTLMVSCGTKKTPVQRNENFATIYISNSQQPNEMLLLKISIQNSVDSIMLDAQGNGKFTVPVSTPIFAFLIDEKSKKSYKLILNSGFNFSIKMGSEELEFIGNGAEANQQLTSLFNLESEIDQFVTARKDDTWSNLDDIIQLGNQLDSIMNDAFTSLGLSSKNDAVSNLIKLESYAFIDHLFLYQILDLSFMEEAMLSFEEFNKLKLHPVLESEKLVRSGSHNVLLFLMTYNDIIGRQIWLHENKSIQELQSALIHKVLANKNISSVNKDFLVYWNIYTYIFQFGLTDELFSLIELYNKQFENPIYADRIQQVVEATNGLQQGQEAFDFTFMDVEGNTHNLKDLHGQYVFIDVWASWCGPCVKNIPVVFDVMKQFPNIKLVYLNTEDDLVWRKFLEKYNQNELPNHFINVSNDFTIKYKITYLPRYILIDENGNIVNAFVVFNDKNELTAYLKSVIAP
jgi:thiol-disulfide isomerase/thioredoxin